MNTFYECFSVCNFCYVLPLLRLHGGKHDGCSAEWCHQSSSSKCSGLLAQWMSSPPLIRGRLSEAMDHAPRLEVQKTQVRAIRTYAEAHPIKSCRFWSGVHLGRASVCCLSTSASGATPTPLGCPSHRPSPHATN